ncbi:hypothetical protein NM688_g4671 [Phlebia brevispora]|uniref:Uncharacterized protein n=1 Tax=Phlebia brevispora TaxID=194682 RepID=A0ACC1T2G4_9APHY|nr:hypothetical protein NM688_g4671 [Phlebia brevispora]
MSDSTVPESVAIIDSQEEFLYNHVVNIALTLACYEYVFRFKHEYEYLQHRKWTAVTWLLCHITLQYINVSLQVFFHVIPTLPFTVAGVFSALRVFALLDHNYVLPGLNFLLQVIPTAVNCYLASKATYSFIDDPIIGRYCDVTLSLPESPTLWYGPELALKRGLTISFLLYCPQDVYRRPLISDYGGFDGDSYNMDEDVSTGQTGCFIRHIRPQYNPSSRRQFLFHVALFLCNTIQLLVDIVPVLQQVNTIVIIFQIIPSILISRFLVNLRQRDGTSGTNQTSIKICKMESAPNFRKPTRTVDSVLGPIGEPLDHETEDPREVVDEKSKTYLAVEDPLNSANATFSATGTSRSGISHTQVMEISRDMVV